MALTPQDQDYYEEKLGIKGFIPFFAATVFIGSVMWPLLTFMMDWQAGTTSKWSGKVVADMIIIGFMIGSIVSVVMNFFLRFLLWMGWLPSRR